LSSYTHQAFKLTVHVNTKHFALLTYEVTEKGDRDAFASINLFSWSIRSASVRCGRAVTSSSFCASP
jgi:hypothetical protein